MVKQRTFQHLIYFVYLCNQIALFPYLFSSAVHVKVLDKTLAQSEKLKLKWDEETEWWLWPSLLTPRYNTFIFQKRVHRFKTTEKCRNKKREESKLTKVRSPHFLFFVFPFSMTAARRFSSDKISFSRYSNCLWAMLPIKETKRVNKPPQSPSSDSPFGKRKQKTHSK